MAIRIKEFGTAREVEDFLNAVLRSDPLDATARFNVRNLTLTFTTPSVTVTFPDTAEFENASLHSVIKEINSQSAGRAELRMFGQGRAGNTAYIALANAGDVFTGGTAATTLGLSAGTVGLGAIVPAKVIQFLTNPQSYSYMVAYDDA